MIGQNKVRAAIVAWALVCASASAFAQTFDFSTVSDGTSVGPLTNGVNGAPVTTGTSGVTGLTNPSAAVTATFTDANDSGNFVFSSYAATLFPALGAPIVLSETGSGGDTLGVSFSQAINAIGFAFSLNNYNTGDTLNVALYDNGVLVGQQSATTTHAFANDSQFSDGTFVYNGADGAVTSLLITATPTVASTLSNGAIASINLAPLSPVPEPSVWAMIAVAMVGVGAAARRRHASASV